MQIPHCNAMCSTNLRCKGCNSSPFAMPSIVSILLPWASTPSTKHEQTRTPSTVTLQAPQSPVPQPSLLPVKCNSSRKTSSNVSLGSHKKSTSSLLIVEVIWTFFIILVLSFGHVPMQSLLPCVPKHQQL